MKKIIMTLTYGRVRAAFAAVLCCVMTTTVFTACDNRDKTATTEMSEDSTALVINLDSIEIKPYMAFGSSLADVEKYLKATYADYAEWKASDLNTFEYEGGRSYCKEYTKGKCKLGFYFANADGTSLYLVSYDYFFPMPLEPVMAELERNGFVNKGEIKFDDFNADLTYLYLSADGSIEVQVSSWEKDGGSWAISFQPFDKNDLNHLVK
jgi:hypothetical protein